MDKDKDVSYVRTCTLLFFPVLLFPVLKHLGKNGKIKLTEKLAIIQ